MKIITRFHLNIAFSIGMMLVIGLALFFTFRQLRESVQKERTVDQIANGIFELNLVTHDYVMYHRERARIQWQLRYDSLAILIQSAKFQTTTEEQALFEEIRGNHDKLKTIFSRLMTHYGSQKNRGEKTAAAAALEERLISDLLTKSQIMVSNAMQLTVRNHKKMVVAQQNAGFVMMPLVVMITLMIVVNSLLLSRSIVTPIAKLHKGSEIIGTGNLDYKVGTTAKDEIGQLSRAFDQMTEKLQAITVSRDELAKEITERKKTEAALENIFNLSPDMVTVCTTEGKFLKVNPSWEKVLGYTQKELLDLGWVKLVHPDDVEKTNKEVERQLKGSLVVNFVNRYKCKDGSYKTFEWQATFAKEGIVHATARDITERKRAEEQIEASLREKVILLQEIHHRVKNNMQVICSLLSLQSHYIEDEQALEQFKEARNRIKSMALVHEKLYQSKDFMKVEFSGYVRSLIAELVQSYRVSIAHIRVNIDVEDIALRINKAIPCGLIINELLSNALKYAFPDPHQEGEISVSLHPAGDGQIELVVSDNGVGIPEALDMTAAESLGLDLVTDLAKKQLHGEIRVERTEGTTFHITFNV